MQWWKQEWQQDVSEQMCRLAWHGLSVSTKTDCANALEMRA